MPLLRTDGANPVDLANSLLDGVASGQGVETLGIVPGASLPPSKKIIPVRTPGTVADSGSANAQEHRLKTGDKPLATVMMDPDEARYAWAGWPSDAQQAFAKKAWYLGLISSQRDLDGAYSIWQWAVSRAKDWALAGNAMDPQDVMELLADGSPDAAKQRAINARAGQTVTQKQRKIDLTDPTSARALVEQAFQQSMGRDPTDAEVRVLTDSLHKQQKANPQVQTSTTRFDQDGNPVDDGQTTTTSGGIDPGAFIQQQAANDPEAAQYQAGTFYFQSMMNALSSPVQ